jgi:hypothetical protein
MENTVTHKRLWQAFHKIVTRKWMPPDVRAVASAKTVYFNFAFKKYYSAVLH